MERFSTWDIRGTTYYSRGDPLDMSCASLPCFSLLFSATYSSFSFLLLPLILFFFIIFLPCFFLSVEKSLDPLLLLLLPLACLSFVAALGYSTTVELAEYNLEMKGSKKGRQKRKEGSTVNQTLNYKQN